MRRRFIFLMVFTAKLYSASLEEEQRLPIPCIEKLKMLERMYIHKINEIHPRIFPEEIKNWFYIYYSKKNCEKILPSQNNVARLFEEGSD